MTIVQDIPIILLSGQQLSGYSEPHLPDPEVYIMMPPLKNLRNVIDKMKNISEYLTINANMAGEMYLRVETDMVTVTTMYKNLEHPHIGRFSRTVDKNRREKRTRNQC
jgi:HUS1 checkpoint protein